METNITFPYHGRYTAKRSGLTWDYWVSENGCINCIERDYYEHYNGKDHLKTQKGRETKELFDDIERKLGRRTDGWRWVTAEEVAEDEKTLEVYPLDGSYRKMKKTSMIARLYRNNGYARRTVYQHTPTNKLYYYDGGWCGTNESYCYDTHTGIRGERF